MKRFLISLNGGGDTELSLVNPIAEEWITGPHNIPPGKTSVSEKIPQTLLDEADSSHEGDEIHITIGSWENDRALNCPAARGMSFNSMVAMNKCIKDNSIEIVGEYHGYIY